MTPIPELLAKALETARRKQIPKNQVLLYEGDVTPDVMVIKSGIVKMYDIDAQGNEKILHLLKSPAILPFAFYTGGDVATRWYYATVTESEVYVMPKTELRSLFLSNPDLTQHLMEGFSREVHEILTRLNSLSKTLARDKLAAALKFLVAWHCEKTRAGWCRVTFPVSHQLLT